MAERVERRLTTILAADVAEYSRLMRVDEDATMRALTACRAIIDRLVAEHRGHIANTAGDAVLADFPSVADGLSCALAIQDVLAKENDAVPLDRRMLFRIGVHLGDVMVKDGDLFGGAVNLAARLEALAAPGGICVSAAVREHIGTRLAAAFTDMGAQPVKNIAEPVHVFRVAALESTRQSEPPAALPLPDKPSVAVLPFANMSDDPEQEFFADGIAEDVTAALARYPSLFVIARNSSFTYKGHAVGVKQVGRELGVRYVLEGSLRKAGNRIRVTAQLVEAETGKHVWAERYDRDLADIFAVQDEITAAVTIAIAPAIAEAERQRAMRKPPGNLDAWAAYQRGLWHLEKVARRDNTLAQTFFQRAVDLDPNFADGYCGLAMAHMQAVGVFQIRPLADLQISTQPLARLAVALDGNNAEAHTCLSSALLMGGDPRGALAEADHALALCPNLASGYWRRGISLIRSGLPQQGLEDLKTSLRLDPRGANLALRLTHVALGCYFLRAYADAAETAQQAIRSFPDDPQPYRWLAAALGQLGRVEEAKAALDKAITTTPRSFDMYVRQLAPLFRAEDYAHMLDGLRKACWQG